LINASMLSSVTQFMTLTATNRVALLLPISVETIRLGPSVQNVRGAKRTGLKFCQNFHFYDIIEAAETDLKGKLCRFNTPEKIQN